MKKSPRMIPLLTDFLSKKSVKARRMHYRAIDICFLFLYASQASYTGHHQVWGERDP